MVKKPAPAKKPLSDVVWLFIIIFGISTTVLLYKYMAARLDLNHCQSIKVGEHPKADSPPGYAQQPPPRLQ